MVYTMERRLGVERRQNDNIPSFPLITGIGLCISKDRRTLPERRMGDIEVTEEILQQDVFDSIFK